jgi:hypothetical protein
MSWKDKIEIPTKSSGYFKELENELNLEIMTAVITFKNSRKEYYQVTKEFNDIRHLENYIAKVDGKQGIKYINYEIK